MEQVLHHRRFGIEAGFLYPLRDHPPAIPPGHRLRQPVHLREIEPQGFAHVAQRRSRAIADDGRGQRRTIAAVLFVDVLDHFLAPLMLEVDVDVGRLVALARNESLEQHFHARGIDRGDAEAIADDRIGGGASALAENALAAREFDDVVHGQEERLVARLGNNRQFVLDQIAHLGALVLRCALDGQTAGETLFGQAPEIAARGLAGRHDLLGIFVAQAVE